MTYRSFSFVTVGAVTAALVAGPGAAYAADSTTHLTAAQMAAELRTAATASTAAAAPGWRAAMTMTIAGLAATGRYVVDPASGVAYQRVDAASITVVEIGVAGRGTYENVPDAQSRKALRMIGHPAARYAFTPSKLNLKAYVRDTMPYPGQVLTDDTGHAGTRTTHDDGSADYAFRDAEGTAVRLHLDPAGILTAARATDTGLNVRLTYAYGTQHLAAPTAADAVSAVTLARAVDYLDMAAYVRGAAHETAADARAAAHGHAVTTSAVRKYARRDTAAVNSVLSVRMVKTRSIRHGVRISATNPWTHRTVAYTVKASGTKVVVTKS